ncbi:MAG TPA: hypothetical protein VKT32_14205 [Chthonomonadaceae bacterium]|nr:hypothetical protein [Chthonomonadaceae bacterium]
MWKQLLECGLPQKRRALVIVLEEQPGVSNETAFSEPAFADWNRPEKVQAWAHLRPKYDLPTLRVRRLGPGRKRIGDVIRLEPDVAQVFPDAESVNEALRFLIRIAREHQPPAPKEGAA